MVCYHFIRRSKDFPSDPVDRTWAFPMSLGLSWLGTRSWMPCGVSQKQEEWNTMVFFCLWVYSWFTRSWVINGKKSYLPLHQGDTVGSLQIRIPRPNITHSLTFLFGENSMSERTCRLVHMITEWDMTQQQCILILHAGCSFCAFGKAFSHIHIYIYI